MTKKLRTPVIVGALLVLPFMLLELMNRPNIGSDFPFPLFGFMWLLAVSFILIFMPLARNLAAGARNTTGLLSLLPSVVLAVLIAWLWVGLVADQMPCFLGVPNCD